MSSGSLRPSKLDSGFSELPRAAELNGLAAALDAVDDPRNMQAQADEMAKPNSRLNGVAASTVWNLRIAAWQRRAADASSCSTANAALQVPPHVSLDGNQRAVADADRLCISVSHTRHSSAQLCTASRICPPLSPTATKVARLPQSAPAQTRQHPSLRLVTHTDTHNFLFCTPTTAQMHIGTACTATLLLVLSQLVSLVSAHGFLVFPGPINDPRFYGAIRGYDVVKVDVSSLRDPLRPDVFCRGKPQGPITDITLQNGVDFTITLAFSLNANHIGPCWVRIYDADNLAADPVVLASIDGPRGCAITDFGPLSMEGLTTFSAASECPGLVPPGVSEASNDMCMRQWTFRVTNADQIKCTRCIMQWQWFGVHLSLTDPERFQNCADVRITVIGDGSPSQSSSPSSTREATPSPTPTDITTITPAPTTSSDTDQPDPSTTSTTGQPTTVPAPTTTRTRRRPRRTTPTPDPTTTDTPVEPTETTLQPTETTLEPTETTPQPTETDSPTPNPDPNDDEFARETCLKNHSSRPGDGPYQACVGENSFYYCFSESPERSPVLRQCAEGTTCKPLGNWIACL
ncbi:hypothetical protein BC831DRAFT_482653 [Entophlyctis helioformis]|nr:hypothetical protein BC831DRAFT_482653 [Entophlyctis helioformis]